MPNATNVDRLTRAEVQEVIAVLAVEFDMPIPKLRWSIRSTRGRAMYVRSKSLYVISMGPCVWRGTTNCLLHEFAHCLDRVRNGRMNGHNGYYMAALRDTVLAWFGNLSQYDWDSEYTSVSAYGRRLLKD